MSYQHVRDQFIARMSKEGLDLETTRALLRAATTLQRYAELACSSEAADRDRVKCPAARIPAKSTAKLAVAIQQAEKRSAACICDYDHARCQHTDVPRFRVLEAQVEARIAKRLEGLEGWSMETQGDPRGYVLRVIPPSYQERNQGRDRHNRDSIGVPSGPTGLRF